MLVSSGRVSSLSGEIIGVGVGVVSFEVIGVLSGEVIGVGVGVMSGEVIGVLSGEVIGVGGGVTSGEVIGVLSGEVIGAGSVVGFVPELLPPPQPPANVTTIKSQSANNAQNFLAAMRESLLCNFRMSVLYCAGEKKSGTLPKS